MDKEDSILERCQFSLKWPLGLKQLQSFQQVLSTKQADPKKYMDEQRAKDSQANSEERGWGWLILPDTEIHP